MKNLFKTLIVGVVAMSMALSAFAQDPGPGKGKGGPGGGPGAGAPRRGGGGMIGGGMQKEILAKLKLTEVQKKEILALDKKTGEALKALREKNKGAGPSDANREAMMKIRKAHQEGLFKILTAAQKAEYEKLMKEAMAKRKQEGGGRGPGGGKPGGKGK